MMKSQNAGRREFFRDVGRGMLVAGMGYSLASDLGMAPLWAAELGGERLTFGTREPLVALLQETAPDKLLPQLVQLIGSGTPLREIVAAGALANARAFGGENYVGFHTFMALMPALRMAERLGPERQALPVLKVLYRNAQCLHDTGHHQRDVLTPVADASTAPAAARSSALREAVHGTDTATAERILASAARTSPDIAWNELLPMVQEAPEVHRIVLAHRAWDMLDLVGIEHAETLLRQSVRYCIRGEKPRASHFSHVPELLTRMLDQYKLIGREPGTRAADDAWVEQMVETLFTSNGEQAADAVAAALAEGMSPASVCEAVCLAANQIVLRDPGRPPEQAQPNKPAGSVHGDSVGVHASDSANAWRHVARFSNPQNAIASLILAGWQVAQDRSRGGGLEKLAPRPLDEDVARITSDDPQRLLTELRGAIREQNQQQACALTQRYLSAGHAADPVFDMLLGFATSEDGALHAEKYYWTVSDEYAVTRPALRNRQLIALARVTASECGTRAPGYDEACRLLGCEV